MPIITYIISTHYNTYYCGITNNLLRRWSEHNQGKSSYLRKFKAKEVIYTIESGTRKEAHKLELQIKKYGVGKYVKKMRLENKIY